MKLMSQPVKIIGLLFLVLTSIRALSQSDLQASGPINLASGISKTVLPFALSDKVNSNYVEGWSADQFQRQALIL